MPVSLYPAHILPCSTSSNILHLLLCLFHGSQIYLWLPFFLWCFRKLQLTLPSLPPVHVHVSYTAWGWPGQEARCWREEKRKQMLSRNSKLLLCWDPVTLGSFRPSLWCYEAQQWLSAFGLRVSKPMNKETLPKQAAWHILDTSPALLKADFTDQGNRKWRLCCRSVYLYASRAKLSSYSLQILTHTRIPEIPWHPCPVTE